MNKFLLHLAFVILAVFCAGPTFAEQSQIPNRLIDATAFLRDVSEAQDIREKNRITEDEFINMQKDPGTLVLDARSLDKYRLMHVAGAKHLAFTDFTERSLAAVIPHKDTRVLIYCNNNIENEQAAFPAKAAAAALNLSTFTSLYSYGYKNVFELGPVIDPAGSKLKFEGVLKR